MTRDNEELNEEVPTNNVSGGNVPGTGHGEHPLPGWTKEQRDKYKKNNKKPLKRFRDMK